MGVMAKRDKEGEKDLGRRCCFLAGNCLPEDFPVLPILGPDLEMNNRECRSLSSVPTTLRCSNATLACHFNLTIFFPS